MAGSVLIWMCQPSGAKRGAKALIASVAALGSRMPAVARLSLTPTTPKPASRFSSASEMVCGTTAMPRAEFPSSAIASSMAELSKP